jgi:hypothetical protein
MGSNCARLACTTRFWATTCAYKGFYAAYLVAWSKNKSFSDAVSGTPSENLAVAFTIAPIDFTRAFFRFVLEAKRAGEGGGGFGGVKMCMIMEQGAFEIQP